MSGARSRKGLRAGVIVVATLLGATPALAVDISWLNTATVTVSPGVYDLSAGANWVGGVAPVFGDTAVFGATTTPNIALGATVSLNGFTFLAGAPAYTFSVTGSSFLTFYGAGIVNGGNATINTFGTTGATTQFFNASSAGAATFTVNGFSGLQFYNTSTASSATITNTAGGNTSLYGSATAGNATITNSANGNTSFYNSSTAGNATITNTAGSTSFYDTSTAGDATITNNSSGSLYFYNNSTGGNARIVNNLGGTVDFSNSTGLLGNSILTAGSIEGAGNFFLGANEVGVGGNGRSTTVSGVITGAGGSLVKTGTGTLTLTGANTYTGNTVVNGGTLTVNNGGSITNAPGFTSIADIMGSTATMNVSGAGSSLSTYTFFVGRAGTGTFNLTNGATASADSLSLAHSSVATRGTATLDGSGTSLSVATNAVVGNGGQATLNIRNGATMSVTNGLFAGVNSASAGIVNIDGAGSSLTASTGTLGLSALSSGTVNVTNGGSFYLGSDMSLGGISNATGNFNVSGGSSARTNRFGVGNGSTVTVTGAGSSLTTADSVNVNTGGTFNLLDNATASLYYVISSGTVTVGPGTVATVTTGFNFSSGGTLVYNVSPAGTGRIDAATADLSGKLKFTGINGAAATYTLLHTTGGITGSLLSNLTTTNTNIDFGNFRNPVLSVSGNDLLLSVDAYSLAAILQPGVTGNAKQIADAVDAALQAGVALPQGFNGVFNLSGDALVAALKQLSGQSAAGAQQTSQAASNSLMGAMFDPFTQGRAPTGGASAFAAEDNDEASSASMAYLPKRKFTKREREARNAVRPVRNNLYDPRWSVWGTAYGGSTTTSGSAARGTNDTTARAFGFITGADYNITRNTTVGFAIGGGGSTYGVAGNLGSGRAETFQLGLFAKHMMGAAYVAGGLGYTFQNVTANRTVTVAGNDQLQAKFNANTFSGRIEGGYRVATPVAALTPYAALQVTNISLPSYGESVISGNNTFALNYAAQDTTVVRTELGLRAERSYILQAALLTLRGRVAWAHDEGNNRRVSAVFGALPGSNFTVNGAIPSKDLALVSAGAEMKWLNNVSLAGAFEGEFGERTTGYGGKGTLRYTW